ncbi:hypothetical protein O6H91_05G035900 [Diphasiastrum complanatum]|nr:hypothetical protein O6H91_05G035900 [Diphasiastrum complanatum]
MDASMGQFQKKFFPVVERHKNLRTDNHCYYDNQRVTAFMSSLYIAALVASLAASVTTTRYGRRPSILLASLSFLIGATLNAAAVNLTMLILGRIMLGIGVGFGNQAVPLYLSEMAPVKLRGALNIMFQLAITIGILAANLINYVAARIHIWGWRVYLGLAVVPATLMFVGGLYLPETPNSLIERGHLEKGRQLLEKVRGTMNVDVEYEDLVEAGKKANAVNHPFRNILKKRNRPQLVMAILLPFFQQFTGINAIMFYASVLFQTLGFGADASLYSAVVTGSVNVLATLVSIFIVDKWGRRVLFLEAGVQMFLSHVVIAIILAEKFGGTSPQPPKGFAVSVVIVMCIYVAGFAWSWGPLGWLVPSEIFPLETRSVGQSISVSVNMFFTFVISQAFVAMLCHFKYGIFLFFSGWVIIMTFFVYFFLPETKNVPIEQMINVWREHWFWKQYDPPAYSSFYEGEDKSNGHNGQFLYRVENESFRFTPIGSQRQRAQS